jgi:polyvinyl alcohol dehydrogenase (cytochrome)
MKLNLVLVIASVAAFGADDPYATQLFQKHCASCHDSEAGASGRVPQVSALKSMTPAAIQKTLESGAMRQQAAPLSADERQKIATLLGTAVTLERKRGEIANLCPSGAAPRESPAWASWGAGLANTRFQSAKDAGLTAQDLPRLKLKWSFAFPDASTMRSQPAVYQGRVFAGGQDGSVYALDMRTGCVYWATTVQSQIRSGITVGEPGGKAALFFGDSAGFVYALDASRLWMPQQESSCGRLTWSPMRPRRSRRPSAASQPGGRPESEFGPHR